MFQYPFNQFHFFSVPVEEALKKGRGSEVQVQGQLGLGVRQSLKWSPGE